MTTNPATPSITKLHRPKKGLFWTDGPVLLTEGHMPNELPHHNNPLKVQAQNVCDPYNGAVMVAFEIGIFGRKLDNPRSTVSQKELPRSLQNKRHISKI